MFVWVIFYLSVCDVRIHRSNSISQFNSIQKKSLQASFLRTYFLNAIFQEYLGRILTFLEVNTLQLGQSGVHSVTSLGKL